MKNPIRKIHERINRSLFDSKERVIQSIRIISLLLLVLVSGSMVCYYGFPKTEASSAFAEGMVRTCLIFFMIRFVVVMLYDFHPLHFLKKRWLDGILILIFFSHTIAPHFFDEIPFIGSHSLLFFHLYFLTIVAWEIRFTAPQIGRLSIGPARLLVLSFVILIVGGTGLLLLPEMTTNQNLSVLDALFTATSASCVTGLTVVDTAGFFTVKGQLVILMLIQLGGISIISFAAFFSIMSKRIGGLKYQSILKDLLSTEQLSDSRTLLRNILKWTIYIEVIGSAWLYFSWGNISFDSRGEQLYFSVFHSISAFNNAGFSLFGDNLYQIGLQNMVSFQWAIMMLVILGGIGFFVLQEVFGISKIRERFRFRWKEYSLMTRINLHMALMLIISGAVVFFFLEQQTVLVDKGRGSQILTSFFQSISTRTAGFNTVEMGLLSTPVLIFFMFLMFIGAGSGSTGGGIKMGTFAIAFKASIATIRGKSHLDFFKRTIPSRIVSRAYSIIVFAMTVIAISLFLLTIAEPDIDFIKLAFEEFSAFATVGLSTGITASLSPLGKAILISSMFIGRVGVLSVAMVLSRRVASRNFQYAEESVMVG